MRLPLAALARPVRLLFPLTPRGLVILGLAIGLLTEGVLRADLAGLFWGSSFLLFTLYALVGGHLFRLAARRTHAISFHLPGTGLFPGDEAEAVAGARLPRRFPPGFSVSLSLPLTWRNRRIDVVRRRMAPGTSQSTVTLRADHRGVYEGTGVILEAHDVLGITAHRLVVPRKDVLTVYPRVEPGKELVGLVEQSDEATVDSHRRRRSEELLEARKYYPGDDVRRLNWKVFAHTDELFLRIGEEVPPPESRILFVLDTTRNPLVPRGVEDLYLDSLVESCASVMARLVRQGMEVLLSRPGVRECRAFGAGAERGLLAALAAAAWTEERWAPELPSRMLQVVVFSSPGSLGLSAVMTTVKNRGWSARLYLQDLAPAVRRSLPPLRDLLFIPRAQIPSGARPPGRRERANFAEALAHDQQAYSRASSG